MKLMMETIIDENCFKNLSKIVSSICFESKIIPCKSRVLLENSDIFQNTDVIFIDPLELDISLLELLKIFNNNDFLKTLPIILISDFPYNMDLQMLTTLKNIKGILRKPLDSTEVFILLRTLFCQEDD